MREQGSGALTQAVITRQERRELGRRARTLWWIRERRGIPRTWSEAAAWWGGAGPALGGAGLGARPGSRGPGRGWVGAAQPRGGRRACGTHKAAAGAAATPESMKDRTQELRTVSPAPACRHSPLAQRAGHSPFGSGSHPGGSPSVPGRGGREWGGTGDPDLPTGPTPRTPPGHGLA